MNIGTHLPSAAFTITPFRDGAMLATLTGFVEGLAVKRKRTVELISTDDCLESGFICDIRTDFLM